MKKPTLNTLFVFLSIVSLCYPGLGLVFASSEVTIKESPGQTEAPLTIKDSNENVIFTVLKDGTLVINKFINLSGSGLTGVRSFVFPDFDGTIVLENAAQSLSNKTINADSNTISNIDDNEIKSNAGISWSKISKTGSSLHDLADVTTSICTTNQILKFSGASWICADASSGPAGTNGTNGAAGSQGPTGATGPQGIAGTNGTNGAAGSQGPTGATGPQGIAGTNGTNGAAGSQGPTGATGPQGIAGTNGTNGAAGSQGPTGATGPQGIAGTNGTNGAAGSQGPTGATGPQGIAGTNGANGSAGSQGPTGPTGANGSTGSQGPTGATGDVVKEQNYFHHTGSTRWYAGNVGSGVTKTVSIVTNTLRAYPFVVTHGFSIDRIQFEVTTTGSATSCIVGIYNSVSNTNLYPNSLIVSGSAQSTAAPTGMRTDTINVTLNDNTLYWFAVSCTGSPNLRGLSVENIPNVLGYSGSTGANTQGTGWGVARTYDGTLPSTFTSGGTVLDNEFAPLIQVRAS